MEPSVFLFKFCQQREYSKIVRKRYPKQSRFGTEKITLFQGETESEVTEKLMSDEGFPKLQEAGGFELLRCHPSTRTLSLISCRWNADELKKKCKSTGEHLY